MHRCVPQVYVVGTASITITKAQGHFNSSSGVRLLQRDMYIPTSNLALQREGHFSLCAPALMKLNCFCLLEYGP